MAKSYAAIYTISEEEAHYRLTEKMNDKIDDIQVEQYNNFNIIESEIDNAMTFSIISSIFTILIVILTSIILLKKIKKIINEAKNELKPQNEEDNENTNQISENEEKILEIIRENPEKAEHILNLLK